MAVNYMGRAGGTVVAGADEIFQGDAANALATGREISPEQAMWIAVVGRAWLDAFETSDAALRTTDRRCDPDVVRAQARRWLVLDHSGWKADREMVCIMAGVDPDLIRSAARRRAACTASEDRRSKATRTEAANDLDTAFLALVACSETLDAAALDKALAALADLESTAA